MGMEITTTKQNNSNAIMTPLSSGCLDILVRFSLLLQQPCEVDWEIMFGICSPSEPSCQVEIFNSALTGQNVKCSLTTASQLLDSEDILKGSGAQFENLLVALKLNTHSFSKITSKNKQTRWHWFCHFATEADYGHDLAKLLYKKRQPDELCTSWHNDGFPHPTKKTHLFVSNHRVVFAA